MKLHDLKKSGRTLIAPQCVKCEPRLDDGGGLTWTTVLVWDLDVEQISKVIWPEWMSDSDRTKVLRAVAPDGMATVIREDPRVELDIDMHCLIGGIEQEQITGASALLKRQEVSASEGACKVRAILLVTAGRGLAPEMCDLLDSDVVITVRANGELFEDDEDPGSVDTDGAHDEAGSNGSIPTLPIAPPVPRNDGQTPEESLKPKPPRKGRGKSSKAATDLPDEPAVPEVH